MIKRIMCAVFATITVLLSVTCASAAPALTTKEKDGKIYTCVNTKAEYYAMARKAIDNHEEHVYVYYNPDKVEWDDIYSNNGPIFTHHGTKSQFDKYTDYSADSVCVTAVSESLYDENGNFIGMTKEYWGTIDVTYTDTKAELAKADSIIRKVLSGISSKSKIDQLRYVVNYICEKGQAGSQPLPGGGYDSVNGAYDVLTGVRTNTVCTSFALTTKRFLDLMGLKNVLLASETMNHVWNMVELDGQWYGIDTTFADPAGGASSPYFLMGSKFLMISYDSKVVSEFAKTHKIAADNYSGGGTAQNHPTQNGQQGATGNPDSSVSQSPSAGSSESIDSATSNSNANSIFPEISQNAHKVDISADTVISPDVFTKASENGQDLVLEGNGYRWMFSGDNLQNVNFDGSFDAKIAKGDEVSAEQAEKIKQAANGNEVYPIVFNYHGSLPAKATLSLKVDDSYAGKKVYVYYLDDSGKPVQAAAETVSKDAVLTFSTDHCSLWFISTQAVEGARTQSWVWITVAAGTAVVIAAGVIGFLAYKKRKQS